jgi:hypothetical protein
MSLVRCDIRADKLTCQGSNSAKRIESAGGATKSANLKRVRVQRADGTIEYHNLLKEPHSDPEVFPLDTVEVRKKEFLW